MLVSSLHRQFRDVLAKQEQEESLRFLDLCVVWRRKKTGEILLRVGGRWDLWEKRYTDAPVQVGRIIDLLESQIECARWAAFWLAEFQAGRPREFLSLFLMGDRGGGKTDFASIFLVTLLIACPRLDGTPAIAWQVSASHADRDELDRAIRNYFPFGASSGALGLQRGDWYRYVEHPKHVYQFVHGPTLTNVSANDAEDLKRGRVDFLLINEAQKMRKLVPAYGLGRLKDKGGLTVFTANPPTQTKAQWILDLWDKEQKALSTGQPFPIKFLTLKSELNDTIDHHVASQVADIIRILDPRLAQADLDGQMLRIGQPAYWEWNELRNGRSIPSLGDVTREFTRRKTGRAYDYVAGVDFQSTPHMATSVCKLYGSLDNPILWAVNEIVADQATEEDLLDLVEEAGYAPEEILFIGDASGQWQDGKHQRGRDSFQVFKSRRFHIVPPVKPKNPTHRPKNPPIEQRVKLVNQLLSQEKYMVDPKQAPKLMEALKECDLKLGKYGKVHPHGYYAHLTDTVGYICWWVYAKGRLGTSERALGSVIERRNSSGHRALPRSISFNHAV